MRFLKIFSLLIVLTVFFYLISFAFDGSIYEDVIRLHVIANSDSEEDQKIKLEVRDIVLEKYSHLLSGYTDFEAALAAAENLAGAIENDVNDYLLGKVSYKCTVSIAKERFPTKTYGDYSLPQGNYTALCIRLGESKGENFWCVLFPPLCLGVSSADGDKNLFKSHGISYNEYELMRNRKPIYRVKFRILELFG